MSGRPTQTTRREAEDAESLSASDATWEPNCYGPDDAAQSGGPAHPQTALDAYRAACRVLDRDGALGMEADGILDNVMAALAALAGVP